METGPQMIDDGLEILEEEECRKLLARGGIGRVALTIGAIPAVMPVNYAYDGLAVVFLTAPGVKLRAALDRTVVAFEVDDVDPTTMNGWSVLAVGIARGSDDARQVAHARALGAVPWVTGARDWVVSIRPEVLSGRRIVPAAEPPPAIPTVSGTLAG